MSILDQWDHKWFGFWYEYGPAYKRCPHAQEFVFPEVASRYEKGRLREYLTTAQKVVATSRSAFPCPFTGERTTGASIVIMTDGDWLWFNDLPDYIDKFNVAIPSSWLRTIEARGYVPPPPVDPDAIKRLEWPPIDE